MKFALKAAGVFLVLQAVFVALMVLVASLDIEKTTQHLRESFARGAMPHTNWVPTRFGHYADNYSHCVAMGAAVLPAADTTSLQRALEHRYIAGFANGRDDPCGAFTAYLRDPSAQVQVRPYTRYWHGYEVYFRPMIRWGFSPATIRWINLGLLTLVCVGLMHAARGILPVAVLPALLVTLALATDLVSLPFSTMHSLTFMVCIATAWAALACRRMWPHDGTPVLWVALVSGAVFAFVDVVLNPMVTLALLLFVTMAAARFGTRPMPPGRALATGVRIAATWSLAYGSGWAGKWVISAIALHPQPVLEEVGWNIARRISGDAQLETGRSMTATFGTAIFENARELGGPAILLALGVVALSIGASAARGRWSKSRAADFLLVASPALLPLAWMEMLRNHSLVHVLFVYRALGMSLAILVGASALLLFHRPVQNEAPRRRS